jgi:hypothetical protein
VQDCVRKIPDNSDLDRIPMIQFLMVNRYFMNEVSIIPSKYNIRSFFQVKLYEVVEVIICIKNKSIFIIRAKIKVNVRS